ncbi:MAG: HAD hydrolase family protein [bacterium]
MNKADWPPRTAENYYQEASNRIGAELADRFAAVKALVLDADGVLTNGQLLYGPSGEALKAFHSRDGLGLVMTRIAGLRLAMLTGRPSEIVKCRCEELRFDTIKLGRFDKLPALAEISAEIGCPPAEMLYMGDDLVDLPVLLEVGLPVTVPEAPVEVREHCVYVTTANGGEGAVREVTDLVLKCQRLYATALERLAQKA